MLSTKMQKKWSHKCRIKSECLLNGQCQVTDVIYECTLLSPDKPNKVYLRTGKGDFKRQLYDNRKSFNNEATAPSKYIWELKETSNLSQSLVWYIAKKCDTLF